MLQFKAFVAFVGVALAVSWTSGPALAEGSNGPGDRGGSTQGSASANAGVRLSGEAASRPNLLEGRVEQVDLAHNLTIAGSERAGLAFEKFKLEPGSEITLNGQPASIDDLNEGDEVRASFSRTGNELRVQRLDIVSGAASTGGTPTRNHAPGR